MSEPATTAEPLDPASCVAVDRTRAAVVNILLVVGVGIALSGALLRWHDRHAVARGPDGLRRALTGGLLAVVVASYLTRRVWAGREALRDPARRLRRFVCGHVVSAGLGALAIPLGLAFGWYVRPSLDAVAPFWVAALALGFLALPRSAELEGLDPLPPSASFQDEPHPGPSEIPQ